MKRLGKCYSFILLGKIKNIENGGNNLRKTGSEEKESCQDKESGTRKNVINGGQGGSPWSGFLPKGEYSHFLRKEVISPGLHID